MRRSLRHETLTDFDSSYRAIVTHGCGCTQTSWVQDGPTTASRNGGKIRTDGGSPFDASKALPGGPKLAPAGRAGEIVNPATPPLPPMPGHHRP